MREGELSPDNGDYRGNTRWLYNRMDELAAIVQKTEKIS